MASAVHVDDLLLFGPDQKEMNKVLKELELDGFKLETEKESKDVFHDFLGVSLAQTEDEKGPKTVKLTQSGSTKKFLNACKWLIAMPVALQVWFNLLELIEMASNIMNHGDVSLLLEC